MLMEEYRKEIADYGRQLLDRGLTEGTSGNLSIYDPQAGTMAISPSGLPYPEVEPEDVVVMDLQGNIIEGKRKPSSEFGLHSAVYRVRKDVQAVLHAHSMYCTTLACMRSPLLPGHYAIAEAGIKEIPLVRYETFGTLALAKAVEETAPRCRAMLLANHGMLACAGSMKEAFSLAQTMEWCAQVQWRCMCAGGPRVLTSEEMDGAIARYKTYGQDGPGKRSGYFG